MHAGTKREGRGRGRSCGWRQPRAAAWALGLVGGLAWGSAVHAAPGPGELELSAPRVRSLSLSPALAQGRIEHRELGVHGLPIRGAYETVRTRPDGTAELVASQHPQAMPQLHPSQARIPATAVPALVAAHLGLGDAPALEDPPALVYILVLGQPVLVWETQLALVMQPEPSRLTLWVSAASGRVLRELDQVLSSRARVFAENPSKTPEPIEVELYDIHVDEAGHPLVGTRVQAFNCVDVEPDEVSPWWDENECWPLQTVRSDAQGDYFVPTPDVVRVADNVDPNDPYAELSMYVHAERFLEAMRAKGVEDFRCELSSMLANSRALEPTASFDWKPLNNAYYTDQCDPERGPTMLFGQGSEVDFGYDGDVVYHELGHGMVAHLSPAGLGGVRLRADATVIDAPGINEGLADYFSIMLTDDAQLAEYVGRFWSGTGRPYIRDAENSKSCPQDIVGESHNDGEPLTAALWATRKRLSERGKIALDAAVLEALMRMEPDADLEQAAALTLETADRQHQLGELSADDMVLLRRSFDARGLLECPRVITDPARVRAGRTMFLRRVTSGIHPFHPGPMQLRYEVPPDGDDMVVSFTLKPNGSSEPVAAHVLVKRGDAPIEFEYQLVAVDDPPVEPTDDPPEDPVRELVLVSGDWDLELEATLVAENDYLVELGGLEPGEVLHVTLVDVATTNAVASAVSVRASSMLPPADPEDDTGSTGEPEELPGVDEVTPGLGAAGCACRAAGSARGGPALAWALGLVLLGLRRRGRGSGRCAR